MGVLGIMEPPFIGWVCRDKKSGQSTIVYLCSEKRWTRNAKSKGKKRRWPNITTNDFVSIFICNPFTILILYTLSETETWTSFAFH